MGLTCPGCPEALWVTFLRVSVKRRAWVLEVFGMHLKPIWAQAEPVQLGAGHPEAVSNSSLLLQNQFSWWTV